MGSCKIKFFRRNLEHNHRELTELSKRVTEEAAIVHKKITEMYENRSKPVTIRHQLRRNEDIKEQPTA